MIRWLRISNTNFKGVLFSYFFCCWIVLERFIKFFFQKNKNKNIFQTSGTKNSLIRIRDLVIINRNRLIVPCAIIASTTCRTANWSITFHHIWSSLHKYQIDNPCTLYQCTYVIYAIVSDYIESSKITKKIFQCFHYFWTDREG